MVMTMGRSIRAWMIPMAVAACSDEVSEAVSGADETTTGDTFTTESPTDDTDPTVSSLTTFDTVTDSDVTSDVSTITVTDTQPTSDTDPSDTDPTTDTDPSDTDPTSDTDPSDTDPTTDTDPSDTDPTTTDTDPSDTDPTTTDTDPSDTDPSDTDPTTTDTDPSDTDPSATTTTDTDPSDTDPSDTDPSDTDPSTSSTSDTETDTDGGGFSEAPAFGTNVLDLDLIGIWSLNWDDPAAFDSVLEVDASGNFIWTENTADCSDESVSTGFLWVEGSQIVMHVETWERQMPWDTQAAIGESYDVPFRLRLSFSLQGSGADDYLAIAGPSRMTEAAAYTSESYIRLSTDGVHLGGEWRGEAELQAIPAGETDPVVVVRDTYRALLDAEAAPETPEGTGVRAINTTYFPMPIAFDVFDGANWTCLAGCPQPSGLTLVDGSNLYTYGPYGGQSHLLSFDSGRVFRSGFDTDCP